MTEPAGAVAPDMAARRSWRRWWQPAAGLAVTAVLMATIASRVDLPGVAASIGSLPLPALALALASLAGAYLAKISRWYLMLKSVSPGASPWVAARTLLASVALNNVLPLRAGDIARVFAFREQTGAPAAALLPLLLLERILDTGMLVLLAALVALALRRHELAQDGITGLGVLAAVVCLAIACLAYFAGSLADRLEPHRAVVLGWLPAGLREPGNEAIDVLSCQLRGRQGSALAVLTALAWGLEGGVMVALAAGFDIGQPVLAGYAACAMATLATLVPSAPGFFGTFHAAAMAAVEAFGTTTDKAAAFAILAHAMMWAPLTVLGLGCLAWLPARTLARQGGDIT